MDCAVVYDLLRKFQSSTFSYKMNPCRFQICSCSFIESEKLCVHMRIENRNKLIHLKPKKNPVRIKKTRFCSNLSEFLFFFCYAVWEVFDEQAHFWQINIFMWTRLSLITNLFANLQKWRFVWSFVGSCSLSSRVVLDPPYYLVSTLVNFQ